MNELTGQPEDTQGASLQGGDLGAGAPSGAPASAPSISPHHDMLSTMLKQAMAKYQAIAKIQELAEESREELDELVGKGDAISDDDVLDAMARLVGKGADPQQLGALMSGGGEANSPPMPQGGPGLAAWAINIDQMLSQKEEALAGPLAAARMEALTASVHLLVAHHVHGGSAEGAPAQPGVSSDARGSDGRSQLGAGANGPTGSAESAGGSLGTG